jgi:DNA-binding Lrp family transcriptional regulator
VVASCITELSGDGHVRVSKCEFDEEGSKTHLELIPGDGAMDEGLLKHPSGLESEVFGSAGRRPPLDELDLRIIRELRKNGRQSNVVLAKVLGTSESTVRRRINSLMGRGIVRGFTALLRYSPGESFMRAFLALKVDPTYMDSVANRLAGMRETCSVYKAIGKHNLICETVFGSRSKFQEFIDEIQYLEGVLEMDYSITSSAPKPCPWYGF